jgi:predicted enzyme involved in methoxymalonyl-ACP biosynthesis
MTQEIVKEKKYSYKDKHLHIFDYDYTLYLNFLSENRGIYKQYVINKIKDLKSRGNLIAMASHNASARTYIYEKYNDIYKCFDMFICEYPRDKDTMVSEILKRLNCKPEQAIFYDDVKLNTNLVRNLGVSTYLVNDNFGINFEDIVFDEINTVYNNDNDNDNMSMYVSGSGCSVSSDTSSISLSSESDISEYNTDSKIFV